MTETRRTALVNDGGVYVGPALAREFARRGHDLVIGDPAEGLVDELAALGAQVEVVHDVRNLTKEDSATRLVDAAMSRFGKIDAAVAFTGQIVGGKFMKSSVEDLHKVFAGCVEGPYHFLRAVAAPMVAAKSGQIVLITSAAGARPTPGAPLYSAMRAAATMIPEFHAAAGTDDPAVRAAYEATIPMRRFGTLEEFAAFSMAFLDGSSGFTTGQFVSYSGGWS